MGPAFRSEKPFRTTLVPMISLVAVLAWYSPLALTPILSTSVLRSTSVLVLPIRRTTVLGGFGLLIMEELGFLQPANDSIPRRRIKANIYIGDYISNI
jgi:hypothetical protein